MVHPWHWQCHLRCVRSVQALEKDLQAAKRAIEVKGADAKEAREELRTLKADRTSAARSTKGLEGQVLRLQKQVCRYAHAHCHVFALRVCSS
jgi:chromosome segregation ATPase